MWHGIVGHDDVVEQFRRTLAAGRLASTYLFVGPPGVGKRRFAIELAHALLCTESPRQGWSRAASANRAACLRPAIIRIWRWLGCRRTKSTLPIELFIGDKEHRNQEGLCHRLGLRPFFGRRKVAIVDDADHFSIPSANCLLKTLEEPPPSALLILIGTSPSRQLPTIRSRSQLMRFQAAGERNCRPDSVGHGRSCRTANLAPRVSCAERRQRRAGRCNWRTRRCGVFAIKCLRPVHAADSMACD